MNELTLHYANQAERERDLTDDLRNRQILDPAVGTTMAGNHGQTTQATTQATATATDPRKTPVRVRATAGR